MKTPLLPQPCSPGCNILQKPPASCPGRALETHCNKTETCSLCSVSFLSHPGQTSGPSSFKTNASTTQKQTKASGTKKKKKVINFVGRKGHPSERKNKTLLNKMLTQPFPPVFTAGKWLAADVTRQVPTNDILHPSLRAPSMKLQLNKKSIRDSRCLRGHNTFISC